MMNNEQFSGQNNTEQIMTGQNISEQRSALKAGKTIPQIILGSAIWTCILAYILILAGQLIGELAVLASALCLRRTEPAVGATMPSTC